MGLMAVASQTAQEAVSDADLIITSVTLSPQLLPFLEEFYPALYPKGALGSYPEALDRLRETEPSKWMEIADDKYFESFQLDHYGEEDYLPFDKPFRPRVAIHYRSIMLSLEGKTFMEERGRQFRFFKHCMVQTFTKHPLAAALRVYITG